ncbi:TKL protein kinase [Saprolegnia parasitica CBS 223.65]|uniref:TKL protein kinase n=1 Tax=Saprolegnia parasitica (strain CBS 223.65) TaxID=695850 RepID=A0A067BWR7_SAPPC|nr:TKL protein kinase [Saprolegnia parasitica CBS 223.65]KDO21280.1 TKL protein kinase [Saprolegnia parasitica CBS 223.65]|eukprot:XP_012208023.1 TKL protein kinase [Saprolegnia parasitica CBS 223.65]
MDAAERSDYAGVHAYLSTWVDGAYGNVNIADPAKRTNEYTHTLVHATLIGFQKGRHAIENDTALDDAAKDIMVEKLCQAQLKILDLILLTRFDITEVCSQDAYVLINNASWQITTLPTLTMRWVEPPYTVAFLECLTHPDRTESGIKPDMCDLVPGQPCVFEAIQRGNFDAAEFFFARGIDVAITNEDGEGLLYNAVVRCDLPALQFLLGRDGINVNQTTHGSQETPLLVAVGMRAADIVQVLVDHGADPSLPDLDNNTPLTIAVKRNYKEIVAMLQRNDVLTRENHVLGTGAVSTVYRGAFKGLDVAVKVFNQVYDSSIWTEIRFLSSLQSEYIVKLIHVDINLDERRVSFVLELMAMNLRERLGQKNKKLSLAEKVRIALDVIQGVAYLHEKQILYCDLKPENVLVTKNGRAKLADFGISQQSTRGDAKIEGTPQYMAPELTGYPAAAPSEASDVYAFGILLTELDANTGEVPYVNVDYDSPYALWAQVRGGLRPELRDDCRPWFRELAANCMATLPGDRPTVSTIIDTLKAKLQ